MTKNTGNYLLLGALLLAGGLAGFVSAHWHQVAPQERSFTITAHKYGYEPNILRVNRGDHIHLKLLASDVTHGFYLEGYDLEAKARPEDPTFWMRHPSSGGDYHAVEEISFIAEHPGKFRYRCSQTCGYMHPFMQGELIVTPNYLYSTSVGLSLGMGIGMLLICRRSSGNGEAGASNSTMR